MELGTKIDGKQEYVDMTSTMIIYYNDEIHDYEVYHKKINTDENGFVSLDDIQKQTNNHYLKVIYEMGLSGTIYTYGNYRDENWYITGKTCGYA